jgi:hypothetical protein
MQQNIATKYHVARFQCEYKIDTFLKMTSYFFRGEQGIALREKK